MFVRKTLSHYFPSLCTLRFQLLFYLYSQIKNTNINFILILMSIFENITEVLFFTNLSGKMIYF